MGNYAMIFVAAMAVVFGAMLYGMREDTGGSDKELGLYQFKLLARDASVSGANLTIRKIAADTSAWLNGANYAMGSENNKIKYGDNGEFYTEVFPFGTLGDTIDVYSYGFHPFIDRQGVGGDTMHTQQYRIIRLYDGGGVPPPFENVITTDDALDLQGNIYIGTLNDTYNANIHTNGHLKTIGNSFFVEGFGTYTGSVDTKNPENFQPNDDTNQDGPNVLPQDSIHLPPVPYAELQPIATVFHDGDLLIDGDDVKDSGVTNFKEFAEYLGATPPANIGTESNPFILAVNGNVTIEQYFDISGYGLLVNNGEFIVDPKGNPGGLVGSLVEDRTTMYVGAVAGIEFAGQAEIIATLHTEGTVRFRGTPDMIGGIVAYNAQFDGGGDPQILYSAPADSIIDIAIGLEPPHAIGTTVLAFAEW